jgi:hypothetical protein
MNRLGSLLIAAALIAPMVSCTPVQYSLTISSTAGGWVSAPGEGILAYDEGMVVSLVATPANGHRFVNWMGDVHTIANVEAALTTVNMHRDYSITADFEPECTLMVAASDYHTVGLKSDGTAVAVGDNYCGQCNVGGWDLN